MNIFTDQPCDQVRLGHRYKNLQNILNNSIDSLLNNSIDSLSGDAWQTAVWNKDPHKSLAELYPNLTRYMGLEIELESVYFTSAIVKEWMWNGAINVDIPVTIYFKAVEDGSLRNNGVEFVSRPGLTGTQILAGAELLLNTNILKPTLSTSFRTSVHVHVNALDFTVSQLKRLYLWYLILEPLFFAVSGSREKNIFCTPNNYLYQKFYSLLAADSMNLFEHQLMYFKKYSALNLFSIVKKGTIEFRHHCGTTKREVIGAWMQTIHNFVDIATADPSETLNETFNVIHQAWRKNQLQELLLSKFGVILPTTLDIDSHFKNIISLCLDPQAYYADDFEDVPARKSPNVVVSNSPDVVINFADLNVDLDPTIS